MTVSILLWKKSVQLILEINFKGKFCCRKLKTIWRLVRRKNWHWRCLKSRLNLQTNWCSWRQLDLRTNWRLKRRTAVRTNWRSWQRLDLRTNWRRRLKWRLVVRTCRSLLHRLQLRRDLTKKKKLNYVHNMMTAWD
jgi:hypothetical protein